MIKKQDQLSILITFVAGFFAGVYVYFAGFTPLTESISNNVPDVVRGTEFVVVSEAYGGCLDMCPSFQLKDDGSYRYLYFTGPGSDPVVQSGSITVELLEEVTAAMSVTALAQQSVETTPAFCESFVDGIDVEYQITLNDTEYTLDTCGTRVIPESVLWQSLDSVWSFLELAGNTTE